MFRFFTGWLEKKRKRKLEYERVHQQCRQKMEELVRQELDATPAQREATRQEWLAKIQQWLHHKVPNDELATAKPACRQPQSKDERLAQVRMLFGDLSPDLLARLEARTDEPEKDHDLREYQAMQEGLASGGELWVFSSPQKTWESLAGRHGYAVVRDGKVVAAIVTILS